jgi:outer membrane protein assembly factor BamD (BamD/ComL family)
MEKTFVAIEMKRLTSLTDCFLLLLMFWMLPSIGWPQSHREPKMIRDTGVAEGKDNIEAKTAKEPNPKLAEKNVNIGNYYLKQKNYAAAVQRFLEAIEYQADLIQAYDGLARAYEKKGEIIKAIDAFKGFLAKNPDSPKAPEFRTRLDKLERKNR